MRPGVTVESDKSNAMSSTQRAAQQRVDRIAAFRAEVEQLRREGLAPWSEADLQRIAAHQDGVLAELARRFDIDRSAAARRMSRGMQIASLIGAAALVAAVVSFFYRIWGALSTPAQVALLVAAPVAAVAAMIVAGRIEKTRYVASLCATVACGAFVLETVALGRMFNLRDSPHALAFWAAFAIALAIPWRLTVPFALGAFALAVYLASAALELAAIPWREAIGHPEPLLAAAALLLAGSARLPRELQPVWRAVLLVVALLPLLVLSSVEGMSLVPAAPGVVRVAYQLIAFAVAFAVVAVGLRRGETETVVVGAVFAGLFIVTRFVDWWWDWMPKYLFFLIMACVAIGWLWAMRIARRRLEAAA